MTRFTLQISDQLNQWLTEQARLNHRSKNGQIEHLLDMARRMPINNKANPADTSWTVEWAKRESARGSE